MADHRETAHSGRRLLYRAVGAVLAVPMLVLTGHLVASGATPGGARSTTAGAATVRPLLFGASTDLSHNSLARVDHLEAATGVQLGVLNWFQSFPSDLLVDRAKFVLAGNRIPMVTWQPAVTGGGVDQPDYSLATIAGGRYDSYLRSWGRALKSLNGQVWLRFAPEMNGDWQPWSEGRNGNKRGSFVAAWRHVHDVVASTGATNIRWVWCPNVPYSGTQPMAAFFPGDAYVDYVGLDGYNFGSAKSTGWRTYEQVFGAGLAEISRLSAKPVVLAEVASADRGGDKAAWISSFIDSISRDQRIAAAVWFDWVKGPDYRMDSPPAALTAFQGAFSKVDSRRRPASAHR
jgi:hypothetical protein